MKTRLSDAQIRDLQSQARGLIILIESNGESASVWAYLSTLKSRWKSDVLIDMHVFHSRRFGTMIRGGKTVIEAAMEQNAYQLIADLLPYCTRFIDLNETITYNFFKTARLSHNQIYITDQILHKANGILPKLIQQLLRKAIQERNNDMVVTLAASGEATSEALQHLLVNIVNDELPDDFDLDQIVKCIVTHKNFVFSADTVTILETALDNQNLMLANNIVDYHSQAQLDTQTDNKRYQAAKESLKRKNEKVTAGVANSDTAKKIARPLKHLPAVNSITSQANINNICINFARWIFDLLEAGRWKQAICFLNNKNKADPNFFGATSVLNILTTRDDKTILEVALERKYYELVLALRKYGAKFQLLRKQYVETYLKEAAVAEQQEVVNLILKNNYERNDLWSLLYRAIDAKDLSLIYAIINSRLLDTKSLETQRRLQSASPKLLVGYLINNNIAYLREAWLIALNAQPPQYEILITVLEQKDGVLVEKDFADAIHVLQNDEKFPHKKLLVKAPEAVIRQALYAAINKMTGEDIQDKNMTSEDIQERKRTIAFIAELFRYRKESCDNSHVEFNKESIISAIVYGYFDLAAWMISPTANWNNVLLIALKNQKYDIATELCRRGAILSLSTSSSELQGLLTALVEKKLNSLIVAGAIVTHVNFKFTNDTVDTLEIAISTRQYTLAMLIHGQYKNTNLSPQAQKYFEGISARLAAYEQDEYDDLITKPTSKQTESVIDRVYHAITKEEKDFNFKNVEYHISCLDDANVASIDDTFSMNDTGKPKTVLQILLEKGGEWNSNENLSTTNDYYYLAKFLHKQGANPSELRKESLGKLLLDAVKQDDLEIVNIILKSMKFSYDEHAEDALKAANLLEQADIIVAIEAKEPNAKTKTRTASRLPQHLSLLTEQEIAEAADMPVLFPKILEMKVAHNSGSNDDVASDNNDDNQSAASEGSIDGSTAAVVNSSVDDAVVITQKPTEDDASCSSVKELDMLKSYFGTMRNINL